jgi:hypothetical protein
MTKDRTPDVPAAEATLSPSSMEKAEKGASRSMWELLLQLRVLLPYLARLVPLLDRGLLKAPDFSELNRGIAEIQTDNRELGFQTRNQAIQLERLEQQMSRLRVVHENSMEESRRLFAEMRSLRRWLFVMAILIVVLLLASAGMVAFLVFRGA